MKDILREGVIFAAYIMANAFCAIGLSWILWKLEIANLDPALLFIGICVLSARKG